MIRNAFPIRNQLVKKIITLADKSYDKVKYVNDQTIDICKSMFFNKMNR